MNKYVVDYARRRRGCYTIEAFVRDGVIQALNRLGWRRKATVMEIV